MINKFYIIQTACQKIFANLKNSFCLQYQHIVGFLRRRLNEIKRFVTFLMERKNAEYSSAIGVN
jgi:hypothetical protein